MQAEASSSKQAAIGRLMANATIFWLRRDLRLEDNPALLAAAKQGIVIPVFVWCPEEEGHFKPGRVSRWWLKTSLQQLAASMKSLGTRLVLRRSPDSLGALLELAATTGATQIFFNHLYDPMSLVRDQRVKQGLARRGIGVQSFKGDLLYEPWEISDDKGQAFTTFAAYWARCLSMPTEPEPPALPPRQILAFSGEVPSCTIEELGLENELEKSSNALLARTWSPGCLSADSALSKFIAGPLRDYLTDRKKTDSTRTSLLSPHLHFGEISVRKIFHSVRLQQVRWIREGENFCSESVNFFLRAIGFREYSRYLCFNFPFSHERTLLANLKHFPWRADEGYFKAWRQGRTGYPLVDAGMRELWATGWLHCKIRVVVASFAVKFLQLPWRWGMMYFWDTLLDADLESDVLGWQYISGSLPDGQELDRLDDPQVQGYKLDAEGEYVRKWLPELCRLPTEWIHHPWDAPPLVLRAAGVELGSNYPRPIVEVVTARERQEQAIAQMWEKDAAAKAVAAMEPVEEETMPVLSATGGPLHRIMDVHRAVVKPPAQCSDQTVPSFQQHRLRKLDDELQETIAAQARRSTVQLQLLNDEVRSEQSSAASTTRLEEAMEVPELVYSGRKRIKDAKRRRPSQVEEATRRRQHRL